MKAIVLFSGLNRHLQGSVNNKILF